MHHLAFIAGLPSSHSRTGRSSPSSHNAKDVLTSRKRPFETHYGNASILPSSTVRYPTYSVLLHQVPPNPMILERIELKDPVCLETKILKSHPLFQVPNRTAFQHSLFQQLQQFQSLICLPSMRISMDPIGR